MNFDPHCSFAGKVTDVASVRSVKLVPIVHYFIFAYCFWVEVRALFPRVVRWGVAGPFCLIFPVVDGTPTSGDAFELELITPFAGARVHEHAVSVAEFIVAVDVRANEFAS
jgi:hypothetical protein